MSARPYARFLPTMLERGFGKDLAWQLARAGLVEVFSIGRATFCYLDSVDTLPERMQAPAAREQLRAARAGRRSRGSAAA